MKVRLSAGHKILPLDPATGHHIGAEFHHLQKKRVDTEYKVNVEPKKH